MFKIVERSAHDTKLKFVLSKTSLPIANGLRRVLLSEIDTPAIDVKTISFSEDVNHINTSSLHDEFLSHRISFAVLDVPIEKVKDLKFHICDPNDTDKAFINSSDDIINFTTNDFTIHDTASGERVDPETIFLSESLIHRLKPRQQLKSEFSAVVRKVKEPEQKSTYNHQPGRVKFSYAGDNSPTSFEIEFCTWGQRNLNAIYAVRQALLVLEGKVNKVIGSTSELVIRRNDVWENCVEIKIKDEDHTLGNILAEEIMLNQQDYPDAQECYVAYQKKHPLENELAIRIKMGGSGRTAEDCFAESCQTLHQKLRGLTKSFEKAISTV